MAWGTLKEGRIPAKADIGLSQDAAMNNQKGVKHQLKCVPHPLLSTQNNSMAPAQTGGQARKVHTAPDPLHTADFFSPAAPVKLRRFYSVGISLPNQRSAQCKYRHRAAEEL